jgi:ParB family chromosome partitioning protein
VTPFADAFAALDAQWAAPAETVLLLPIDLVVEDPDQPREQFDPEALRGLAQTVRDKGVLQPITVWPANPAGAYVIRRAASPGGAAGGS